MRVMVLVKGTDDGENNGPPSPDSMAAMGRFNAELHKAGVMLMAEGLTNTHEAKRVGFDGTSRTVLDGPFAETRELVAGFWLWEVKDMAEAVAWAQRCPDRMEIELRPLMTMAEIEARLPPEILALGPDRVARWEALGAAAGEAM